MNVLHCTVFLSLVVSHAEGHGYLINPAQRSSAWRNGYTTPVNNDDNGLNCGGFGVQWNHATRGKCGTCGDPYYGDRQNEAGGKYATGTITGTYAKGRVLKAEVVITAHHQGWFEFRLCAVNNPNKRASQKCLDQTVLDVAGNKSSRYYITGRKVGTFVIYLQLPAGLTCKQCVLQWLYKTGNSWGCDGSNCGIGLGPQEQFKNCADIEIKETVTASTSVSDPSQRSSTSPPTARTSTSPSTTTTSRSTSTTAPAQSGETGASTCRATGGYTAVPGMDAWCVNNCKAGNCPKTHCACT